MVRLVDVPEPERSHLVEMECPTFDRDYFAPWRRCETLVMRQHHRAFRAEYLLS